MFQTCDNNLDDPSFRDCETSVDENIQTKKSLRDAIEEAANFLREHTECKPKIGIICGSGLGALSNDLENALEIPYSTIPNFPVCTVQGHQGKLIFGKLSEVPVMCMKGRFHLYEGYPLWKCTLPVRIMQQLGVKQLIVTNAAGGVNITYKPGDVMIIEDHIDLVRLFGNFSLRGPGGDLFKFNYSPVNEVYDKKLIQKSIEIAEQIGLKEKIHKGVYTFSMGPNFESNSDVRMLKVLGTDAVGSSSVHEAIVAKNCGMDVFAFSLVTNLCSTDDVDEEIDHNDVLDTGRKMEEVLKQFVRKIVEYIDETKFKE